MEELRAETDAAIRGVLDSGTYILASEVEAFEREFAEFCEVESCIGVGNGLDALQLVLRALDIGRGDEVIVPAYTAVATWMAVALVGATPIAADVHASSWNIDPESARAAVSPRTKAIIAVHLFGQPADMDPLATIAERNNLYLIEDAAQAHGARYRGRRAGSLAHAATFSFYPTKNLGAVGDGGAVTTDDADLADTVRRLRTYGWRTRDVSEMKGINSRLDELQAAILRVRLLHLERWIAQRAEIAALYRETFASRVDMPDVPDWAEPVWHLFVIASNDRESLRDELANRGVGTLTHYSPLPHQTPAFRADGWRDGSLPVAERLSATSLSLPLYPQMDDASRQHVVRAVLDAIG